MAAGDWVHDPIAASSAFLSQERQGEIQRAYNQSYAHGIAVGSAFGGGLYSAQQMLGSASASSFDLSNRLISKEPKPAKPKTFLDELQAEISAWLA